MIFGWRKRQIANTVDAAINEEPTAIPVIPKVVAPRDPMKDDAVYTIGRNPAGYIQLRMTGDGYTASTLTMSTSAVRSLIRQLEAAIPEEEDESND